MVQENIIEHIAVIASGKKLETFLVGGYVRDKLLGIVSNDIDIMVIGDAVEFANDVANSLNTT